MNVGRLVFPAIRWQRRSVEEVWPEVQAGLDLGVGGFVVFGGSVSGMKELVVRAHQHAARPLLFASDFERGAGQQLEEATPLPPVAALAGMDDQALLEAARLTAQEAASAGIGWVLAPVCDLDVELANPIVGTRSFGGSPLSVSDRAKAWVLAAQGEGVHACAKHFPGHGRTTTDSHSGLPVVGATREQLEADLVPFVAAIEAEVASVMLAHVSYPALDPSGVPASLSPAIVKLLRDALGFDGMIATDAFIMEAVAVAGLTEGAAAVRAVRAGCDVILYPKSPEETMRALNSALESEDLDKQQLKRSAERVEAAAASAEITVEGGLVPMTSYARALELATDSIQILRGFPPDWVPGQELRLHIVDDDIVALPDFISAPGTLRADRGRLAGALEERNVRVTDPLAPEPRSDLIALFSEVKAWKGRAGLAPKTVAMVNRILDKSFDATVVLFGHPRLADELPSAVNIVCAWNGDPLMQDAAVERLIGPASR
jgi:beta-glucosidase